VAVNAQVVPVVRLEGHVILGQMFHSPDGVVTTGCIGFDLKGKGGKEERGKMACVRSPDDIGLDMGGGKGSRKGEGREMEWQHK